MFTRFPAEIRNRIYEYLLIKDEPLHIEAWEGLVMIQYAQRDSARHNNRGWALFSANRRCRDEGLYILLSKSHFIQVLGSQVTNEGSKVFRLFLSKRCLQAIKYVTIALVFKDDWWLCDDLVSGMRLLNLFFKEKVRMTRICILHRMPIKYKFPDSGRMVPLAHVLAPLAVRLYVSNMVHQLYLGSATSARGLGYSRDDHMYLISQSPDVQMNHVSSKLAMIPESQEGIAIFDAWYMYTRRLEHRFLMSGVLEGNTRIWSKNKFPSSGLMQLIDRVRWRSDCRWYGQRLLFEEYDVSRDHNMISEGSSACKVRLIWFRRAISHSSVWQLHECEFEDQAELTRGEFNELQDAHAWWELWWAAHRGGQRKITEWLSPRRA